MSALWLDLRGRAAREKARLEAKARTSVAARLNNARKRCCETYAALGIEYRVPEGAAGIDAVLAALGPCPPGHVLGRVGNEGHYEIGNLRWLSRREWNEAFAGQAASSAASGKESKLKYRLSDGRWAVYVARENGVSAKMFRWRLAAGWSIDRAAQEPPGDAGPRRRKQSGF